MQANPHRGEVNLTLGDQNYVLRPSFSALVAIEEELQTSVLLLAQKIALEGVLTLQELSSVCRHTLLEYTDSRETLEQELLEDGIMHVLEQVSELLNNAIVGMGKNNAHTMV